MITKNRVKTLLTKLDFKHSKGSNFWEYQCNITEGKTVTMWVCECRFGRKNKKTILTIDRLFANKKVEIELRSKDEDRTIGEIIIFLTTIEPIKQELRKIQLNDLLI